ncbi:MAG: hypothetical protein IIB00_02800 [candidate division Zixibacteria bacterium]|nr:hypothetical protein [candidate division Zixibacteria bacterium]
MIAVSALPTGRFGELQRAHWAPTVLGRMANAAPIIAKLSKVFLMSLFVVLFIALFVILFMISLIVLSIGLIPEYFRSNSS